MDLDLLLIQRMKSGDNTAIESFIRKYYPQILSTAASRPRSRVRGRLSHR